MGCGCFAGGVGLMSEFSELEGATRSKEGVTECGGECGEGVFAGLFPGM